MSLVGTVSPREIVYDDREFPALYIKSRRTEDENSDFIDLWLTQNSDCPAGEHLFPLGIPRSDKHRPDRLNIEKYLERKWEEFKVSNPFIKKEKNRKGRS